MSEKKGVRIVGGPEPWKLKFYDAESGAQLQYVTHFVFSADGHDGVLQAEMRLMVAEIDMTVEVDVGEDVQPMPAATLEDAQKLVQWARQQGIPVRVVEHHYPEEVT